MPTGLSDLRHKGGRQMKFLRLAFAVAGLAALLTFAAPVQAATTQTYHATFVENGAGGTTCAPGTSCGSATFSRFGHVPYQSIVFDACGPNCHIRTVTFEDGSTLLIQESVVGENPPHFLEISQTILGGTGIFAGATGSGTGRVNLAANAIITASGTITLP